MPDRAFTTKVILAFAALYIIWGSTYYAIQVAGKAMPPLLMAGTRFLCRGVDSLGLVLAHGALKPGDLVRRNWMAAAVVGFGLMLIGNGGVALALQRIPTGISAVIVALTPMWLVVFDWIQRRDRRPSNAVFAGIALGVAGIATLKLAESDTVTQLDLLGIVITGIATIGWAFGSIWGRTAPRASSPVTACAMQMLAGGVILLVVSPMVESWSGVSVTTLAPSFWFAWGYLVVFGSLCGFTAYIWLLQNVSAAKVGTYAYVNPIIALGIGVMLNGERFSSTQVLACGLILIGVVVITVFRSKATPQPTTDMTKMPEADIKRATSAS